MTMGGKSDKAGKKGSSQSVCLTGRASSITHGSSEEVHMKMLRRKNGRHVSTANKETSL